MRNTIGKLLIGLLIPLSLMSCKLGPDFHSPSAPETRKYTEGPQPTHIKGAKTKGGEDQFLIIGEIPEKWWKLFHSNELNCLIKKGLARSPNLDAAFASLIQAQENRRAFVGQAFAPAITGQLSAQRERTNESAFGIENVPPSVFSLYDAQINVSYNLDFFGVNRRTLEGLCAEIHYKKYLLEAAYLTLTSNIVTTAITEASLRAQIKATIEIIDSNEKELDIIRKQFKLGGVSAIEVLAQETQLAQVKATLPPLRKNLAATRHALAVLIGEFPSEADLPHFSLDQLKLPTRLPVSLPSTLIRQRPDIRASEALLHQASANIGVATANLFPQISLTGNYGYQSDKIENLFTPSNNIWTIGGQLLQPIFNGGSLRAKRRASIAAFNEANAQYRQTVLQAFQNVADALRALEFDAKTLKAQTESEQFAKKTLFLVQKQFKLGGVNYLDLLNAERQYQQTKINRIQAQAARFTDTAALFQALGGGWWHRDCK